jgi:hypothetical protein
MDFTFVLSQVADEIQRRGRRFAVIGGVGLAALGMPRTTLDLDLVVEADLQDELVAFLEQQGYATLHRSAGYSNHLHADPRRGRIDLVYVQGGTADRVFAGVNRQPGPGGLPTPVPRPEHLAALKVLAMKNDPSRIFQDLADIRFLLTLPGVDRAEVRGYFARHGLLERFHDVERTL